MSTLAGARNVKSLSTVQRRLRGHHSRALLMLIFVRINDLRCYDDEEGA